MEIEPKNNDGLVVLLATEECPVFVRQHVKEQSSRLGLQSITEEYIGEAQSYRYELISLLRDASIIVADITRDTLALKYFVGMAIGLGKPIIFIENQDEAQPPSFDVARISTLAYSSRLAYISRWDQKIHNELIRAKESPVQYRLLEQVQRSTRIFVSYSRGNLAILDSYRAMMEFIESQYRITFFIDETIDAGNRWHEEIETELNNSDISLLLLSPSFFQSDFITTFELPVIKKRYRSGNMLVIPVVLSECKASEELFSEVQSLNPLSNPIEQMTSIQFGKHLMLLQSAILDAARKVRLRRGMKYCS